MLWNKNKTLNWGFFILKDHCWPPGAQFMLWKLTFTSNFESKAGFESQRSSKISDWIFSLPSTRNSQSNLLNISGNRSVLSHRFFVGWTEANLAAQRSEMSRWGLGCVFDPAATLVVPVPLLCECKRFGPVHAWPSEGRGRIEPHSRFDF